MQELCRVADPFVESQQAPAKWAERHLFTPLLLDAAWVTGIGIAVWGRAGGPRQDASAPHRLALLSGPGRRVHGDVLGQPGALGGVPAVSMQQRRLPDDQVASGQRNLDDRMAAYVGGPGDRASLGPFVEEALLVAVNGGDALETAHIGGRVLQREYPLQPEWDVGIPVDVGVPVDEAGLVVVGTVGPDRRLERHPVDGDPQLVRVVQVAEDP